jgi:hypothetical protein
MTKNTMHCRSRYKYVTGRFGLEMLGYVCADDFRLWLEGFAIEDIAIEDIASYQRGDIGRRRRRSIETF